MFCKVPDIDRRVGFSLFPRHRLFASGRPQGNLLEIERMTEHFTIKIWFCIFVVIKAIFSKVHKAATGHFLRAVYFAKEKYEVISIAFMCNCEKG